MLEMSLTLHCLALPAVSSIFVCVPSFPSSSLLLHVSCLTHVLVFGTLRDVQIILLLEGRVHVA